MAEGYQALTAKEKEALRLLLGGHDAKSMANQLGLSVHTINERLRDARRKLSVSGSKAAARHSLVGWRPSPMQPAPSPACGRGETRGSAPGEGVCGGVVVGWRLRRGRDTLTRSPKGASRSLPPAGEGGCVAGLVL